ncbi:hypothetical protein RN001_013380 [Aquatica leii]|uniref:PiggyBac transposable element-derived protein 4 C-terminal zinc-ribbon domain-containing protein n=1 Tax=Aquatica leii TaxID=1421715 RepID=A0AAN7SNQ1_9COLE|nr:hypothetical protein RN001_013380 [Aquatica leii]
MRKTKSGIRNTEENEDKMNITKPIYPMISEIGKPSTIPQSTVRPKLLRRNEENRPIPEVQHVKVDHMPHLDNNKKGKRCKYPTCNKKTHFYCDKCSVHLCIKKERNCFVTFHRK